jgi:predicted phosphate transport protein (TIGR00153 family)
MARKTHDYYFNKLNKAVGFACEAADMLSNVLGDFKLETLEAKLKEMHVIEHAADIDKHEMMSRLVNEFITPIEREDIIQISQEIDDIIDQIEEILQYIYMYNLKSIREEAIVFAGLIVESCNTLKKAVEEFSNFKKSKTLKAYIIECNRLEDEGDRLYAEIIRKLFKNTADAVQLFSWVKIFDLFESTCDSCEHAANSLERIVLKNY